MAGPHEFFLNEQTNKAMRESAQTMANSTSEVAQSIRNLDNTVKEANKAAREIKLAGIWLSSAIGVIGLVQVILAIFA